MMQAASDIFLGWTKGVDVNRYFYWRQLRDMKGSAVVESMMPVGAQLLRRICGWTLARAHARSGDPIAIAEYLGEDDQFDRSITDFSERYADQNERDYQAFADAIRSGRLRGARRRLSAWSPAFSSAVVRGRRAPGTIRAICHRECLLPPDPVEGSRHRTVPIGMPGHHGDHPKLG